MTGFWLTAALLTAVGIGFLLVPLWREKLRSGRWSASGLVATAAVVPAAVGLYFAVSTYDTQAPPGASPAEAAMVRQLADRLVENPDNPEGWRLLARSYMVLGEYRLARDAFLEAFERTSEPDDELKLGLGEAMIYTDASTVRGQAGDLIEEVLASEPTNQRALWWGGVVAAERGDAELARDRWTTLLAFNPPPDVSDLLRRQLAALPPGAAGAAPPGSRAASDAAPAAGGGPKLTLDIAIADDMPVDSLGADSYLFVFARAPGGGPPIAGARYPVDSLPGTFTLSDANAIIAGRSLAAFPELTVVARISVNGDPIEQPGDLYAEASVEPGKTETVDLLIDRIVPAP